MTFAPRRTDRPEETINLVNKFFPWKDGQPVFLNVPQSPFLYLPVFTNEKSLNVIMGLVLVKFDKIKQILNTQEFIDSIPIDIKIALDFHKTEMGTFRWIEVQR